MGRTLYGDAFGSLEKVDGKEKGMRNELVVAKLLSKWTGVEFNRTPASGGLRWIEASRISGDVVAPINFNFPFSVETKFYAAVAVEGKLRVDSRVFNFWDQCCMDAVRAKRLPMMFLRRNGMPKGEFTVFVDFEISEILSAGGMQPVAWVDYKTLINPDVPWLVGYKSTELLSINYIKFIERYEQTRS